jgi:hypothetical protein
MAEHAEAGNREALVLRDADGPRPLPSVLMVAPALAHATKLLDAGERRLRALIADLVTEELAENVWKIADPDGAWRQDVDVPGDLPRKAR